MFVFELLSKGVSLVACDCAEPVSVGSCALPSQWMGSPSVAGLAPEDPAGIVHSCFCLANVSEVSTKIVLVLKSQTVKLHDPCQF